MRSTHTRADYISVEVFHFKSLFLNNNLLSSSLLSTMPGLKRSQSVYQGLNKKMLFKNELRVPTSSNASTIDLEDSPSHFELEPARPVELITLEPATPTVIVTPQKQEPMNFLDVIVTPQKQPMNSYNHSPMNFLEGLKRYNGYSCKFLKKPIKLQIYSAAMSITCNTSVAVFSMPRLIRDRIIKKVDELLSVVATSPFDLKKNPFTHNPVFLGLGHHARLFRQLTPGAAAEPFGQEELKRGMYFHGRLSVEILGVKSKDNFNELSLMIRVKELFMMADHLTRAYDDENMGLCTLEEPIDGEDGSEDDGIDY